MMTESLDTRNLTLGVSHSDTVTVLVPVNLGRKVMCLPVTVKRPC